MPARHPGPLSEHEWTFVRQHPVISERIINGVPGLEQIAAAVRATHERWDGTGYPDGLSGETIPLAARIIAVCDAYDAMTSPRPYRQKSIIVTEAMRDRYTNRSASASRSRSCTAAWEPSSTVTSSWRSSG